MAKRMKIGMTDPIFTVGVNTGHRPIVWHAWLKEGFINKDDWFKRIREQSAEFEAVGIVPVLNPINRGVGDQMNSITDYFHLSAGTERPRRFMVEYDNDGWNLGELQVRHVISKGSWGGDLGASIQWQLMLACYDKLALENLTDGFGSNRLHLTVSGAVAISTIMGFPVNG